MSANVVKLSSSKKQAPRPLAKHSEPKPAPVSSPAFAIPSWLVLWIAWTAGGLCAIWISQGTSLLPDDYYLRQIVGVLGGVVLTAHLSLVGVRKPIVPLLVCAGLAILVWQGVTLVEPFDSGMLKFMLGISIVCALFCGLVAAFPRRDA